jgi:2-dehydro-3-deoxy-D-gluconate 5-dehydrogenase
MCLTGRKSLNQEDGGMSILDLFRLDGKVALVTGCSRLNGLGCGMAEALAEAGADIVAVDARLDNEASQKICALGRRCLSLSEDLTAPGAIPRLIDSAVHEMGRLDILVNNAGIIRRTPAIDFAEKDWDDVLALNLKAVFFMSQAVARIFLQQGGGGKIINVASMLSFQGGITVPSYTSSKSGVAGLTRALANEWAKHGIHVNAIAPGYMATDNTEALRKDPVRSASILDRIPAGRWGVNSDLKGAVVFLASAASDYVDGHVLAIDGGWLAR